MTPAKTPKPSIYIIASCLSAKEIIQINQIYKTNTPMTSFDVCVTIASALLTIAYPILIEVISRLDEKYGSTVITDLFYEELEKKTFTLSLYTSIGITILYLCELKPNNRIPQDNWYINNSAIIFLSLCVTIQIISFFFLIKKIFIYYRQRVLVKYLIEKQLSIPITNASNDNSNSLTALSELLIFSIKIQNEKTAKEISSFLYSTFKKVRDAYSSQEIRYPIYYYDIVYQAIEELASLKSKKLSFLENFTAGSVWLLGELSDNKVSDLTYSWIWANQLLALRYDRDDFVLMHWQNAHQFYDFQLQYIQPEYSDSTIPKNQEQINQRIKERNKFFYFHIVLGALLLYLKKYYTLKKIFDYTQSIPPRYVLLPETMDEIFTLYFKMSDHFDEDFSFISSKFSFPDFHGLQADDKIKKQICLYLALLFLRQYSIVKYLVYQEPLILPTLPKTQGKMKKWLDHLPFFKSVVNRALANKELLSIVTLDFITEDYCKTYNKKMPLQLLDEFEETLETSIQFTEINQNISTEKEEKFKRTTTAILSFAFETYKDLQTSSVQKDNSTSNFINGSIQLLDKSSFADDQEADSLNYDSIVASTLSDKFKRGVAESFYFHKTEQYLIKSSEVIAALDKLQIQNKDMAIVTFAYNLNEYPSSFKLSYPETSHNLVGSCLFVLKKEDLPVIIYNDVKGNYKEDYNLENLTDKFNLYASVIDLNKKESLREEALASGFEGDVRKQILISIFIDVEIRWKKGIKCIAIQVASPYREDGILNTPIEIKKF